MEKVQKKTNTKLSLGKMTVAKLSQQHMRFFNGGVDTEKPKETYKCTSILDVITRSIVDEPDNQCGGPIPPRTAP